MRYAYWVMATLLLIMAGVWILTSALMNAWGIYLGVIYGWSVACIMWTWYDRLHGKY